MKLNQNDKDSIIGMLTIQVKTLADELKLRDQEIEDLRKRLNEVELSKDNKYIYYNGSDDL